MEILLLIEDHYQLTELKWRKDQELIDSSAGLKRIQYWDNQDLLHWHIDWRDHGSIDGQIIMDRMIRTKNEEPAISFKNGWLTLHDEVTEPFSADDEKKWGLLLAGMLTQGHKIESIENSMQETITIDDCFSLLTYSEKVDDVAKIVLEKCYHEAKRRFRLANELLKKCKGKKLPVIEKITSLEQGKQIYNLLFWQTNTGMPEIGYKGIRRFLEQWLQLRGENALVTLLTTINEHFLLEEEQGLFLLAECLIPWELYDCLQKLKKATSTREAYTAYEQYNREWETSRKLVEVISGWLDQKREKVAT